jgi:hypothetical protein
MPDGSPEPDHELAFSFANGTKPVFSPGFRRRGRSIVRHIKMLFQHLPAWLTLDAVGGRTL